MRAWSEWGIWSYTATVTQTAVGGGALIIDVTAGAGNVMEVLYARFEGTFAAADTLFLWPVDEDNVTIVTFAGLGAASGTLNVTFPRANTNIDSTSNSAASTSPRHLTLAGPDLKFTAETSALAQNDTLQLLLEAKVKHGPGSVSVARSGGTPDLATPTVNEVY